MSLIAISDTSSSSSQWYQVDSSNMNHVVMQLVNHLGNELDIHDIHTHIISVYHLIINEALTPAPSAPLDLVDSSILVPCVNCLANSLLLLSQHALAHPLLERVTLYSYLEGLVGYCTRTGDVTQVISKFNAAVTDYITALSSTYSYAEYFPPSEFGVEINGTAVVEGILGTSVDATITGNFLPLDWSKGNEVGETILKQLLLSPPTTAGCHTFMDELERRGLVSGSLRQSFCQSYADYAVSGSKASRATWSSNLATLLMLTVRACYESVQCPYDLLLYLPISPINHVPFVVTEGVDEDELEEEFKPFHRQKRELDGIDSPVTMPAAVSDYMDLDSASKRTRYDDSPQEMDEMKAFVDRVATERDAYTRMRVMLSNALDMGVVSNNSGRKVATAQEVLASSSSQEVQQVLEACRLERQRFNVTYSGFKSK